MLTLLWLKGLLSRHPGRLLGAIIGVALTVALLASIGTFTVSSAATMTQRAIVSIPIDWQIQLASGIDPETVVDELSRATSYTTLQFIGYAGSDGFSATTNGTVQTTAAGKVLGISSKYHQEFAAEFRLLTGSLDGVLAAQQTAANLQIAPGDVVTIQRPGLSPVQVKIDGVIDLPYADSLFQAIGTPLGIAPQAPPDNVLLLPLEQWHQLFDPQATVRPDSVHTQLHVQIAHNLPDNPGKAYTEVRQRANNLEARIAGNGVVGDNLAAKLDSARAEALYARVLFLFLGLPGMILAVLLTLAVAATGNNRRQQEQALLRMRGADTARILRLACVESLVVGVGGMGLGLGLAILATLSLTSIDTLTRVTTWVWMGISALAGLGLAIVSVLLPAWKTARSTTVMSARAIIGNRHKPLWQLIWLDALLLTLSAIMFWRSASINYQVVVAPEGVPQTSVSYELFIAPVCLWLGAALLTLRLSEVGLVRGRTFLSNLLRVPLGSLASIITASLSRQRSLVTSGIGLVALAFSFAISTAIFNTTYNAQSRVDAELTNGADIQVVLPPGSSSISTALQEKLETLPGVAGLQPMQHRFAYVGQDLQDLYGINPVTLPTATHLANAYFASHNAEATMNALAIRMDGVLVSEETVQDFQLKPGDLINLRLQSAEDGQYHVVPFHFIDVVREFPTAPTDSFLVANAEYIAKQTHNDATETVLIRAKGGVAQLTPQINQLVNHLPGVKVTDLNSAQRTISSSLTAVDLHGLTRLELSFAVLLLAGATGLVLALGMTERRHTFAILSMIGANPRQLGAFLWTEGLVILVAGGAVGTLIGFAVAEMLVKILTGVFDPPPETLSIPWSYLIILVIAASVSTAIAVMGTQVSTQRIRVEALRDV